jgi:hypothetical protein
MGDYGGVRVGRRFDTLLALADLVPSGAWLGDLQNKQSKHTVSPPE